MIPLNRTSPGAAQLGLPTDHTEFIIAIEDFAVMALISAEGGIHNLSSLFQPEEIDLAADRQVQFGQ